MELPKFDEEADFVIHAAARIGDGLQLEIEITEFDENTRTLRAECDQLLEYVINDAFGSSLELSEKHPLLWEYQHDSASAYFTGVPSNSLAAVGAIVDAHWAAVNDWFSVTRYLNKSTTLKSLLESGDGLLAQGPLPLLEIYRLALKEHGTEVQIVSPYPSGGRLSDPETRTRRITESRVLLMGSSYAIGIGWHFSDVPASMSE